MWQEAASPRCRVLPLGLVARFCASSRRQQAWLSLPCLGVDLWLRAKRLLRLQNLAPHSRHTRSPRLAAIRRRRMRPSARACHSPSRCRIMRLGPSRQKIPNPLRKSRLRRSKCAWVFGRHVRGPLLHLDADEARLEHNLPWVDLCDVQLRRRALAVEELEHVVGRAV